MHKWKGIIIAVAIITLACVWAGCGGGTESAEEETGGTTTTATTIFPADLVVSSPYAVPATSGSVSAGEKSFEVPTAVNVSTEDYVTKKEALESMLTATSTDACGFNLTLFAAGTQSVNCYAPSLGYENYPDATPPEQADGQSGGGDSGIWDEYNNGEACVAAQTNALVSQISATVDTAVNSFASMVCVINADGLTIPSAGGTALDVTSALQDALTDNGITALSTSSATLEHQADDADGNNVYFFTLTGTATNNNQTRNIALYLKHIPLDADNTTYKGKLSYAFTDDSETNVGNCEDTNTVGSATTDTTIEAGSILYHKDSATNLTYRLQTGRFCDSSNMPLDVGGDYDIDPIDSASPSNPTGYANGFKYSLFNMNPEDGTGSFAFVWAAGTGSENGRTLNVTLDDLEGGGKGGCAYFGYGPSISSAGASLGEIDGFVCNWGMPAASQTNHPLAQRQCVSYDESSQKYVTDNDLGELAITYAPTGDCSTTSGTFTYHSTNSTEGDPATNDRYVVSGDVDNGLIDIDEVTFTLPTVPTDVY